MNLSVSYQSFAIGLTNVEQNVTTTVLLIRRSRKFWIFFPRSLGACCVAGLWDREVAVSGEVGGCPAMLRSESRTSAVLWIAWTDCCSPRLRQGSPAGEGGEAALPRGECSPVGCWRVHEQRETVLWGVQGEGGAVEGMTSPAPVPSVTASSVSQKRLF